MTTELCMSKHEGLAKEMGAMSTELKTIKEALVGSDLQGGLVKKINDMNSKLKMGRTIVDWIKPILIAVAAAGTTALLFRLIG